MFLTIYFGGKMSLPQSIFFYLYLYINYVHLLKITLLKSTYFLTESSNHV